MLKAVTPKLCHPQASCACPAAWPHVLIPGAGPQTFSVYLGLATASFNPRVCARPWHL